MLLASDAINTGGFTLWMFFLHVDLESFLVFIVPVTLGTLECFASVPCCIPPIGASSTGQVQDEVTVGTFNTSLAAIDVLWAGSNGCSLKHVSI